VEKLRNKIVAQNTKIKECICSHEYQDHKYGKNKRVMNSCKSKDGKINYRCTVCGKEQE